jgi:hypothetical protein
MSTDPPWMIDNPDVFGDDDPDRLTTTILAG